jgi:RNA polymerase sigma-70 factor (ECF subfamily)
MAEPPTTQPSLLLRLRDARDDAAWGRFVELYAPLVYGYLRRQGLQDADAADVTQEVLRAVAAAIGRLDYDPQRGSFRGWLRAVVRSKLCNFLAARRRQGLAGGETVDQTVLQEHPAPPEPDSWDQEYERRLFAWAAEQVRGGFTETSWRAFWQTAVEGRGAAEVADALGISVGAVYIAKSRVLARLRREIRQVLGE